MNLDFRYLAISRQLLVQFYPVVFHDAFDVFLLQAMGESIVEVGIDKCYKFIFLQDNQRLGYIRHVVQFAFYFLRIDVLSAGCKQHVLAASSDGDVTVFVHGAQVTGVQPAVRVDDLRCGFRIFIVTQHQVGSAADDFACYMLRVVGVNLDFHS